VSSRNYRSWQPLEESMNASYKWLSVTGPASCRGRDGKARCEILAVEAPGSLQPLKHQGPAPRARAPKTSGGHDSLPHSTKMVRKSGHQTAPRKCQKAKHSRSGRVSRLAYAPSRARTATYPTPPMPTTAVRRVQKG